MLTRFDTLFTISVDHEYYAGQCPDFRYHVPVTTVARGNRGRLLFKQRDDRFHCLYEADGDGNALSPVAGEKLVFGLVLTTPYFANYSVYDFSGLTPCYRNANVPDALAAPLPVRLSGELIHRDLASVDRPVTIDLKDPAGATLDTLTLSPAQTRNAVNFDSRHLPEGRYQVKETYAGSQFTSEHYLHRELLQRGVFGIVEIELAAPMYTTPPAFTIPFLAREEIVKYYIVAENYTDGEFNALTVTDQGFLADGRSEITFTRFLPAQFTSDDIDAALLEGAGKKLAVFKSNSVEKRHHAPRHNIQLNRNGETLIPQLPSPGADTSRQEFVISLEKP